ncbi:MAG: leucine-rich repeat protein, partial [Prevotellaceae bacterium]|nr:leucine-rich repeat protein [Prevotellaceae bacterium]
MRQTILNIILLIALLLGVTSANAYDFTSEGIYYNIVSKDALTCTVVKGDSPYSGDVVIPKTVTSGFLNEAILETEEVTYKVIGIANNAFQGCSDLTSITLSDGLETIGRSAFKNCSKLKTLS